MPSLPVPIPKLTYDAVDPGLATIEKPIEVRCGPVALPDGAAFGPGDLGTAGLFVYRQQTAASTMDVWNEETQMWTAAAGTDLASMKPLPFFYKPEEPAFPWQGIIVAAGQTDKDDNSRFEKTTGNYPQYSFRSYFAQKGENGASATGLSASSPALRFISLEKSLRAGVRAGKDERPEKATEVHLFLRNEDRLPIGEVAIYNESGRARIEIATLDAGPKVISRISVGDDGSVEVAGPETSPGRRPRLRLDASGDVDLQSAPGSTTRLDDALEIAVSGNDVTLRCAGELTLAAGKLKVEADAMETERIRYQPATLGGGATGGRQWLQPT